MKFIHIFYNPPSSLDISDVLKINSNPRSPALCSGECQKYCLVSASQCSLQQSKGTAICFQILEELL